MHNKLIEGYMQYSTAEELAGSSAASPEVSPTPATPISTLSVASFSAGVTTYHLGC